MTFKIDVLMRRLSARLAMLLGLVLMGAAWSGASLAEKLVEPGSVAPEYRAAAEKRRAEQMKLYECSKKADAAKVLRRDRATYVNECLEK
jgi:hypothetical protein